MAGIMHKPLNASLFSVIDLKASHWFEPSQAHSIFKFRFPNSDLTRCGFSTRICNAIVCADRALKTESKRKARGRSRGTVLAQEMRKGTPGSEHAPAEVRDGQ